MLKLQNVTLSHGQERWLRPRLWQPILQDINLELQQGELVALVGSSGEGKSLLLQSILGLLPNTMKISGQIMLDNTRLTRKDQQALRGNTIGYIPQSVSALNPLLKIGKQLIHASQINGQNTTHQTLCEQLSHYNLCHSTLNKYPLMLSGGMAKRLLMISAALSKTRFILADEVTAWLDQQHSEILLQHLKSLCLKGQGILWVTHDLHLASHFADRVILLNEGTIKETVTTDTLCAGGGSHWLQSLWQTLPEHQFHLANRHEPSYADN